MQDDDADEPLAGRTVGITAARRREELGSALERRGAQVVYGPAIRIVALADDTQLRDATRRCLSDRLDYVIATTASASAAGSTPPTGGACTTRSSTRCAAP